CLEEDVTQLSLVMHHAILDGWSVASLLAEWGLHIESGRAPEPPRSRFSEFIALERASAASDAQREFWKNELSDSVPAVVEPWAASTTEHGHRKLNHAFSPELSRKVAAFARARRLPLKTVLLA